MATAPSPESAVAKGRGAGWMLGWSWMLGGSWRLGWSWRLRESWMLLATLLMGCSGGSWTAPTADSHPPQLGYDRPALTASSRPQLCPAEATSITPSPLSAADAGSRLQLGPGSETMPLAAGRWVVEVTVPPRHFVTIGVAGPRDALARFEVIGQGALRQLRSGTLHDDQLLPSFVAFDSEEGVEQVTVVVDVRAPVQLLRTAAPAPGRGTAVGSGVSAGGKALSPGQPQLAAELQPQAAGAMPLVGLPFGSRRGSGYRIEVPPRYAFVRADVAEALRGALRQTRVRYRRNRITIGDTSQWNGQRPATDLGKPRHISHEGGRDVDIALPTRRGDISKFERRCEGVMAEEGRLECGPGTVRDFDAARTAYLLGLLLDGPTPGGRYVGNARRRPGPVALIETIFTDQAYIDQIRKELPKLRQRNWIHAEAYGALGEEGLLRASPWHTDHMHIRFAGAPARVPEALKNMAVSPAPIAADKIRVPTGGPK